MSTGEFGYTEEKQYSQEPRNKWSLRLIFNMGGVNSTSDIQPICLNIVQSIDEELYKEFRIIMASLTFLGFFYPCKLRRIGAEPNIVHNPVHSTSVMQLFNKLDISSDICVSSYEIDSLDLTYWHRVIYHKLNINYKPARPIVAVPTDIMLEDGNATIGPDRVEFYYNDGSADTIIEVMKIETIK